MCVSVYSIVKKKIELKTDLNCRESSRLKLINLIQICTKFYSIWKSQPEILRTNKMNQNPSNAKYCSWPPTRGYRHFLITSNILKRTYCVQVNMECLIMFIFYRFYQSIFTISDCFSQFFQYFQKSRFSRFFAQNFPTFREKKPVAKSFKTVNVILFV